MCSQTGQHAKRGPGKVTFDPECAKAGLRRLYRTCVSSPSDVEGNVFQVEAGYRSVMPNVTRALGIS